MTTTNAELAYLIRKTIRQCDDARAEMIEKLEFVQAQIARDLEVLRSPTTTYAPSVGYVSALAEAAGTSAKLSLLLTLRKDLAAAEDANDAAAETR